MAEGLIDGRRALRAVLQRTTSAEVAARCRVSGPTVRLWALGERNPSDEHREKLESLYGIPRGAWGAAHAFTPVSKSLRS
jgi:transcriptional regulator with XRE-family HTH domain